LALAAFAIVLVSGCAPWGTGKQEVMLDAAGFRERKPQTPMQQNTYESAPSYELLHGQVNGQSFYAYKNRAKGVAFVGRPTDYQRYKELAHQEKLGQVD
jgi:hypothetical protein